ncbi:unnamed protein product [Withania somnifera]
MAPGTEEEHVETSMNGNKMHIKNFIWSEEEWPSLKHDDFGDLINDIPVISLNNCTWDNNQELHKNICQDIVKASGKWGLFKLEDHGVPSEIVENFTSRLHELFDLPMEQNLKGGKTPSFPLGYYASNPEYEQNLPWAETLQLLQSPEMIVQFAKRVYANKYHTFSNAMIEYMKEMDRLGMTIMEYFFSKNFEEKEATIFRISRYPPCPPPEKIVGIGIHSDPQTLTILYQDLVGGLQAVVNKEKQRLSMAYFMNPTSSATTECPPQLINPVSNPRNYVPFTWAELRYLLLTTRRVRGRAVAINKFLISR